VLFVCTWVELYSKRVGQERNSAADVTNSRLTLLPCALTPLLIDSMKTLARPSCVRRSSLKISRTSWKFDQWNLELTMQSHEQLDTEAVSPLPENEAAAGAEFEPDEGLPTAQENHVERTWVPTRARRRSRESVREAHPDTISLTTELRQMNVHLRQLIEDEQARYPPNTRPNTPCPPVTSTEISSGSCLLHNVWYSGFDAKHRKVSRNTF
jgi:hypothetical protein